MSVYHFTPYHTFEHATIVGLEEVEGEGYLVSREGAVSRPRRFKTKSLGNDGRLSWKNGRFDCGGFLKTVERPTLVRMLRNGYISKRLFDLVIESTGIWRPEQLRIAVSWSELTLDQARRVFDGKIPWERVMRGETEFDSPMSLTHDEVPDADWSADRVSEWESQWDPRVPLRFVRAVMMAGVGHVIDPTFGVVTSEFVNPQTRDFHPSPDLAWQKDWRKKRDLDPLSERSSGGLNYIVEMTRALSESGPLPGNIMHVENALVLGLEREFRSLGVEPEQVIVFARAFDTAHVFNFVRRYGGRIFTQAVKNAYDSGSAKGRSLYESQPIPSRDQLDQRSDWVVYSPFDVLLRKINKPAFSDLYHSIWKVLGYPANTSVVDELIAAIDRVRRSDFIVNLPGVSGLQRPIIQWDVSFFSIILKVMPIFMRYGIDETVASRATELLVEIPVQGTDTFSSYATERGFVMPNPAIPAEFLGLRIYNLSEVAATASDVYIPAVLMAVHDRMFDSFQRASEVLQYNLLKMQNTVRQEAKRQGHWNKPQLRNYSSEELMSDIPVVLVTSSPVTAMAIRKLGGEEHSTLAHSVWMKQGEEGPVGGLEQTRAWSFVFTHGEIEAMKAMHPQIALNSRRALQVSPTELIHQGILGSRF